MPLRSGLHLSEKYGEPRRTVERIPQVKWDAFIRDYCEREVSPSSTARCTGESGLFGFPCPKEHNSMAASTWLSHNWPGSTPRSPWLPMPRLGSAPW